MVSDWQGGDISKLFPALSGKEDLSMGEDKKADKKEKAYRAESTSSDDNQP